MSGTISTPCLGFSKLVARLSRSQSLGLLKTAFDNSITHFELARMAGYGAAESMGGNLITARRASVTMTLKAGILSQRRSRLMQAIRAVVRCLLASHLAIPARLRRCAGLPRSAQLRAGGVLDRQMVQG